MQNYPIKVDFRASAKINIKKLIFTLQTAKTKLSISFSILHLAFCISYFAAKNFYKKFLAAK